MSLVPASTTSAASGRPRSGSVRGLPCLVLALLGVSLVSAAPAATSRPPTQEPGFHDLDLLLAAPGIPLVSTAAGDGVTIPDPTPDPLLDRLGADLPCGSVIAAAATRALVQATDERRAQLQSLLAAPRLATTRSLAVMGEDAVILFDTTSTSRHATSRRDIDSDSLPDAAQAVEQDARTALGFARSALGWNGRFASGDGTLHVMLAASDYAQGTWQGRSSGVLVVPLQLQSEARLAALAHQIAHATLTEIEPALPTTFVEAVATWFEGSLREQLGGAWIPHAGRTRGFGSRTLLSPGLNGARADADFLHDLTARQGLPENWLREVLDATSNSLALDRSASSPITPELARQRLLDALDSHLRRNGTTLGDAVFSFQQWRLEQELLESGAHANIDFDITRTPAEDIHAGNELPPFGELRLGIETPPLGGLRASIEAESRVRASLLALLDDGSVREFPLTGGHADRDLALPGSRLVRVVVLVSAPEAPDDWRAFDSDSPDAPGSFTLNIACDAGYPFLLSGMSAGMLPSQITLEWTTSSEEDLSGWLVERSTRPGGPFARLSTVPFPAQSEPQRTASYAFVDADVKPGSRYHYRVIAISSSGLGEPTPVLTVRTLPEALHANP